MNLLELAFPDDAPPDRPANSGTPLPPPPGKPGIPGFPGAYPYPVPESQPPSDPSSEAPACLNCQAPIPAADLFCPPCYRRRAAPRAPDPGRQGRQEARLAGRPRPDCGGSDWHVKANGDAYCGSCYPTAPARADVLAEQGYLVVSPRLLGAPVVVVADPARVPGDLAGLPTFTLEELAPLLAMSRPAAQDVLPALVRVKQRLGGTVAAAREEPR